MTGKQYRDAIGRLGLSQQAAGRFLGLSPSSAGRYARGDVTIPEAVAMLLRYMIRENLKPEDVKGN